MTANRRKTLLQSQALNLSDQTLTPTKYDVDDHRGTFTSGSCSRPLLNSQKQVTFVFVFTFCYVVVGSSEQFFISKGSTERHVLCLFTGGFHCGWVLARLIPTFICCNSAICFCRYFFLRCAIHSSL